MSPNDYPIERDPVPASAAAISRYVNDYHRPLVLAHDAVALVSFKMDPQLQAATTTLTLRQDKGHNPGYTVIVGQELTKDNGLSVFATGGFAKRGINDREELMETVRAALSPKA